MKKIIYGLLLLLPIIGGCASVGSSMLGRVYYDELSESEKLLQTGRYRQAEDELTMLLEMDPRNERVIFLRALAYQQLEKMSLAIGDYNRLLRLNPDEAKAYYNLGMIYAFKLNDSRQALIYFDKFLSVAPEHKEAFTAAKIMCAIDEKDEMLSPDLKQQEMADRINLIPEPIQRRDQLINEMRTLPESSLVDYMMGQTYEMEGNNREAVKYYKLALEKRPTCARCSRSLGNLLIQQKDGSAGRVYLLKARLFDPNSLLTPP